MPSSLGIGVIKSIGHIVLLMMASIASANTNDFQTQLDRAGVPYHIPSAGKAILVNIPAFELIAFQDGAPVLRSRVIVGTPENQTPRLNTYVSAVRFRPTWRPTASMVASGEYEDWIRPPGINNPLGLVAVRLEPGLLVYLHDTNNRALFNEPYRALSHGCVRVEQWDALAAFVLDIAITQVHQLANGGRTFDAPTPPIPVTLGYFTRFPDRRGQVVQHSDIYDLKASIDVERACS